MKATVRLTEIGPEYYGFNTYPSVGEEDWRYAFQTARVRALETQMLTRTTLADMSNALDFPSALSSLGGTEYTLPQGAGGAELETALRQRRAAARETFEDLMLDAQIAEVFRSRDDFANLRLAVRRMVTDRPVGTDYSADGNVLPEVLRESFEEESYAAFPAYVREATEQAVLAYYQNKDIRQIDYALDAVQTEYKLRTAEEIGSVFLWNLFNMQIDLTNLRTMLRLKLLEADPRGAFLAGGFVELDRFGAGLETAYEAMAAVFFGTPYHHIVEAGAAYVAANGSFLKVEQLCDDYVLGYLRTTTQVTAGPQPVVGYLLMKEQEIRTVRLILTAKRNSLDTKLILDRLA